MRSPEEVTQWLVDKDITLKNRLFSSGHIEQDEEVILDIEEPELKKNDKVVKISDLISDNFHVYWTNKKPYSVLKGGRSSLKSSAISLKLVKKFLEHEHGNVISFRKVGKYLSTSVYEQIKWAIYMYGVQSEFTFLKSPLKIIHDRTNTAFYFYGVDDPMKIKSHKIAEGYVTDLWFEETAEFEGPEEIDTVSDTFIREDLPDDLEVNIHFSYNPPRNPYLWINEWIDEIKHDSDYFIHHSTYKQDSKGFLSDQFLRKVKRIEKTDPDYHDWMYGGKVTGLGDVVYNFTLFNEVDEVPDMDELIFADVAIDSGYSVSATTFLFIGYSKRVRPILLDTFYYSPVNKIQKKAPSEFSKDLWDFTQRNIKQWSLNIDTWTIDSAEGALRNQFFKDYGIMLGAARKKTKIKMIENVEDLLAQDKVYVLSTENNQVFLDEHKKYQWDEKSLLTPEPKVIKMNDHTCDAYQYYVNNNLDKLGLKV